MNRPTIYKAASIDGDTDAALALALAAWERDFTEPATVASMRVPDRETWRGLPVVADPYAMDLVFVGR